MISLFLAATLFGAAQGECNRENWSEGDPVVLSDRASCLKDPEVRTETERRATSGDKEAASLLVDYYLEGSGDDPAEAIRWLRVYSKITGSKPLVLAQLLLQSDVPLDQQEAVEILRKKASEGDAISASLLGDFLDSNGETIEAIAWYEVAAAGGHVNSMIRLGELLLTRPDQPSRSLGVLWTIVASNTYSEGTFKREELERKASEFSARYGLDFEAISQFAGTMKP